MSFNQLYSQRANWRKFAADIARGARPKVSCLHIDDLRTLAVLLNFPHAGQYDSEMYQWDEGSVFWGRYTTTPIVKKYKGELEIVIFDTSHGMHHLDENEQKTAGRWLRWKNKNDLWDNAVWCDGLWTAGTYNLNDARFYAPKGNICKAKKTTSLEPYTNGVLNSDDWEVLLEGPPGLYLDGDAVKSKIHYNTWVKGEAVNSGEKRSWQGGWQAKRNVQDTNTPPPQNLDDWESIGDAYETATDDWQLVPDSGNYLHDFSVNFPGSQIYSDIVTESQTNLINLRECHPSLYFPRQVDPAEQFEHVIRAYKELAHTNLSGKRENRIKKNGLSGIEFNPEHITVPATLGPIFGIRARLGYYQNATYPYIYPEFRDPFGILNDFLDGTNRSKQFYGTQYGHTNTGKLEDNSNINGGSEILGGGETEWTFNPKIGMALQNAFEVILCNGMYRLAATELYKANYRRRYFVDYDPEGTYSDEDIAYFGTYPAGVLKKYSEALEAWEDFAVEEYEYWHDFPRANDELFGDGEAGIATFLRKLGKFDYAYKICSAVYRNIAHTTYYPFNLVYEAYRRSAVGQNPPDEELEDTILTAWDMAHDGFYDITFKRSCGRASPFMRSQERGEPNNYRDTWSPTISYYYPGTNYDMPCKWFGPRTNSRPTIDYFDSSFADITHIEPIDITWQSGQPYKQWTVAIDNGLAYFAKQNIQNTALSPANNSTEWTRCKIYSFSVDGDITASLKTGWMVHLFNMAGANYPAISDDPDVMKSIYVLKIRYKASTQKTIITVSDTVNIGSENQETYFTKIGWDINICTRHDAIGATYEMQSDGSLIYKLHYFPMPELLLELKELINFAIYRDAQLTATVKNISFIAYGIIGDGISPQALWSKSKAAYMDNVSYAEEDIEAGYDKSVSGQYILKVNSGGADVGTSCCNYGMMGMWDIANNRWAYSDYYGLSNNFSASTYCVKYEWPDWLKKAPRYVLTKFVISEFWSQWRYVNGEGPYQTTMAQQTSLAGITVTNKYKMYPDEGPIPPLKKFYHFVPMETTGKWYISKPTVFWDYNHVQDYVDKTPDVYACILKSDADMNMTAYTGTDNYVMIWDREDAPVDFYNQAFIHTDAPRILTDDDNPPEKPSHHFDPYGYLKRIQPYSLENPANVPVWVKGTNYNQGQKVYEFYNDKKELFTAKNNIVNVNVRPKNNPSEWDWTPPYVELRRKAESTLCQDVEKSDPVKYRLRCQEDGDYDTEYATSRTVDDLLKTIQLTIGSVTQGSQATLVSGTTYQIACSGTHSVDDVVEILGSGACDGIHIVVGVGLGYIQIDFGFLLSETFPAGCSIINRTKTYTETDWLAEEFCEYNFAWQARDSANNVQGVPDNESELSDYAQIVAPADYSAYFDE